MTDESSVGTERDGEVQQAHCDRCGTIGEHLVCIKPSREGGLENWKPLCDDCLEELGEWFQSVESGNESSEEGVHDV